METRSRRDYFEAALELMAAGGAPLVTIANLCDRLGVTKGSFYHHFASGPEFMRQLLTYWEVHYEQELVEQALLVGDPLERIEVMKEMAVGLQHEAESAIRALARVDDWAAQTQRRVDDARWRVVRDTLRQAGFPPAEAGRRARTAMSILVGMQQFERPVVRAHMRQALEDYQEWLLSSLAVTA